MKLTIEEINKKVVGETYFHTEKTTMCVLTLENGYEVIGTSGVVNPENFNLEIGKEVAKKRAIDKIWELEGYMLQETMDTKFIRDGQEMIPGDYESLGEMISECDFMTTETYLTTKEFFEQYGHKALIEMSKAKNIVFRASFDELRRYLKKDEHVNALERAFKLLSKDNS